MNKTASNREGEERYRAMDTYLGSNVWDCKLARELHRDELIELLNTRFESPEQVEHPELKVSEDGTHYVDPRELIESKAGQEQLEKCWPQGVDDERSSSEVCSENIDGLLRHYGHYSALMYEIEKKISGSTKNGDWIRYKGNRGLYKDKIKSLIHDLEFQVANSAWIIGEERKHTKQLETELEEIKQEQTDLHVKSARVVYKLKKQLAEARGKYQELWKQYYKAYELAWKPYYKGESVDVKPLIDLLSPEQLKPTPPESGEEEGGEG